MRTHHATLVGQPGIRLRHSALQLGRCRHGIDGTGELHQRAIPHQLDDAPVVGADHRFQDRLLSLFPCREGSGLVELLLIANSRGISATAIAARPSLGALISHAAGSGEG